ncbi:MAG: dipeptide/oligopeptide/nickel ABC transporter permease/ATP-binding protein [Treponema sp.]|jgi:peptide/nickel transport system permease protein|nr:dipeptide/oligopeptide/nickel ABC transporter permease/ATP-binding protein [Treponema sp.]
MKRFLHYLKRRPLGVASIILLAILYLLMLFAEFIAPYSPATSFADKTYHPPNVRFADGKLQAQKAQVINTITWKYARVRGEYTPIRFFAPGQPYKLWGFVPMERHLFSAGNDVYNDYPAFLMGADNLGRDIFSRIIYGSRISLTIGFIAAFISLSLAILFGGLSGYFGGFTDWAIMRFSEFFMLIPGLYLILFLRSLLSNNMDSGQSYLMITLILSLVGWPGSARTIRGMVHAIKREEFVMNAQLETIPSLVIIARHIIPQIASLLIVSVALSVPGFILTETTLSYLGLGIVDPAVSWGSLIKRDISTLSNLRNYPWLLAPVWFLLGVTLAFNFIGDALRDYYDPYHTIFPRFGKKKPLHDGKMEGKFALSQGSRNAAVRSQKPTQAVVPDQMETGGDSSDGRRSPAPLLEASDLRVSFPVLRGAAYARIQAVRGVSFSLERGSILGIVGESGSGKSVATHSIPGLLPASAVVSGSVKYDGKELLGLPTAALREYRGRKIGMIFQEPGRSYDPLQNMASVFFETLRNSNPGISREEALVKAESLLAETGLPNGRERLANFPHQFSGGQLQRIGIALALAQNCELLIADEPTTALDVTIQKQIVELLKALRKSRQISIIFISHDIDLVADISDRIMVMYGGMVMESADSAVIASSPRHPYTKSLVAASPRFGSHYSRDRLTPIPGKVTDPARPEPGCPFAPRCTRARSECAAAIPALKPLAGNAGDGGDASGNAAHIIRCVLGGGE